MFESEAHGSTSAKDGFPLVDGAGDEQSPR
jgi:hypothetical protein